MDWDNPVVAFKRNLRYGAGGNVGEKIRPTFSSRVCAAEERNIRGFLKPYPKCFQCPLSFHLMTDPVLAEDGIIYERNSIQKWFDAGFAMQVSPETQVPIGTALVPNPTLKFSIQQWMVNSASPLHMACGKGDIENVKQLIHKEMSSDLLNLLDLDRRTPLEYAVRQKHTEIVSLLLSCDHITLLNPKNNSYDPLYSSWISGFTESDFNKEFAKLKKQFRMETVTEKYSNWSRYYGSRKNISSCINGTGNFEGERYERSKFNTHIGGFLPGPGNSLGPPGNSLGNGYPKEMMCLLSYNFMVDPVTAEDGINYERHKIQEWFDAGQTISPITNESIGMTLVTNHNLKTKIDQWIAENISELHMACRFGNVKEVTSLIDTDMSADLINGRDADHKTPLEAAVAHGNTEIVSFLLTCANVDFQPNGGKNALVLAAISNHPDIVSVLLDDGRFDTNGESGTALIRAARLGHENLVRILLNNDRVDANANTGAVQGTALHVAASNGRVGVVRTLLNCSRINVNSLDHSGLTPLHEAVRVGQVQTVRLLVNDPRVRTSINASGGPLDTTDPADASPLHEACNGWWVCEQYGKDSLKERVEMVKALLDREDIITDEVDQRGYSPMMLIMKWGQQNWRADICASMAMEFLKRGMCFDQMSTWFDVNNIKSDIRFYLYRLICSYYSSMKREQCQPLLTFHLSRLNTAHGGNPSSSLRCLALYWPALVNSLIESFLMPREVGVEEVIARYVHSVHNVEGYAIKTLFEICERSSGEDVSARPAPYNHEDLRCFLEIGGINVNELGPGNRTSTSGVRLSPMKVAQNNGADEPFLTVLRNAGGKCFSQQGDSPPVFDTLRLTVRDEESSHYQTFQLTTATSLQDVLNEYASTRSVNRKCLVFRFNQVEIGANATCESLMLEDESVIHVVCFLDGFKHQQQSS